MENKHLLYTWEEFAADVEKIANAIKETGREFSNIYGIPRGGLPLAVCLSHRLNIPLREHVPLADLDFILSELDQSKKESVIEDYVKQFLIVDDIADTGATLKKYQDNGFFIATLFKHDQSVVEPDVWMRKKEDRWIVFPWETS